MAEIPTLQRDADFFARRRLATPQRRKLTAGLRILFWALRLYVILMLGIVAFTIVRLLT